MLQSIILWLKGLNDEVAELAKGKARMIRLQKISYAILFFEISTGQESFPCSHHSYSLVLSLENEVTALA